MIRPQRHNLRAYVLFLCFCATPTLWAEAKVDAATQALIEDLDLRADEQPISEAPHWKKPKRVVVFLLNGGEEDSSKSLAQLRQAAGDAELVPVTDFAKLPAALKGADALLGFCTPELLQAGADLRWIQSYSAGVDRCVDDPAMQGKELLLTNMQRVHGPAIAEHVMAMLLSLARGLPQYGEMQNMATWKDAPQVSSKIIEIKGRTMLIVGLGGIGTEIAKRAHALGMRVIATRNSKREGPDYIDYVGLANELPKLAKDADVVVNATPLTPATQGLFDAAIFNAMPSHAYFINIGRGKSAVTADLIKALKEGDIAAAALDVTDPEPLPKDSELWHLPNVIITPHMSASSDQSRRRVWLLVRENLRRYVQGEPMLNVVDIQRGY